MNTCLTKLSSLVRCAFRPNITVVRDYAKKPGISLGTKKGKIGKMGSVAEKVVVPVETDAAILATHACCNYLKEGKPIPLGERSEYPEWLWELRTGSPPPLEEMDPNTIEYWLRARKLAIKRNNRLLKSKKPKVVHMHERPKYYKFMRASKWEL